MIHEEIKKQQEKLKQKSLSEKWDYFWYYYKFHVIAGITALILITLFCIAFVRESREPSIYVALVNSTPSASERTALVEHYASDRSIDTSRHPAKMDYSMRITPSLTDDISIASSQQLMAHMNSGDVDVYIGDEWMIDEYVSLEAYENLEECLPGELLARIKDILYYADAGEKGRIPVAIYADDLPKIRQETLYPEDVRPLIAISRTSHRKEAAVDFIQYLLEE